MLDGKTKVVTQGPLQIRTLTKFQCLIAAKKPASYICIGLQNSVKLSEECSVRAPHQKIAPSAYFCSFD